MDKCHSSSTLAWSDLRIIFSLATIQTQSTNLLIIAAIGDVCAPIDFNFGLLLIIADFFESHFNLANSDHILLS